VIYANSVLGARCNRNSGIIELFGSILGKVPKFDLLTDEGRRATWVVDVQTAALPPAQLLGSAVGMKVMEEVPYIRGLDAFLGTELNQQVKDYLKDFGAACASNGAVGLYHVSHLTPEAVQLGAEEPGAGILAANVQTYVIDDAELERIKSNYPNIWKKPNAKPEVCFVGCPHLSRQQLSDWEQRFAAELGRQNKKRLAILTILTAAPEVLEDFRTEEPEAYTRLLEYGVRLTSICPLMYMNNPLCAKKPIITNSNKLRTYTTARYFNDDEIVRTCVKGGY
jgi:predicted aconitase